MTHFGPRAQTQISNRQKKKKKKKKKNKQTNKTKQNKMHTPSSWARLTSQVNQQPSILRERSHIHLGYFICMT